MPQPRTDRPPAAGCRPAVKGNGLNVLLVTIETTRADHLGLYGFDRDTTPRLASWAAGGAVFERHSSVSPRTNPSLAALLTATYPHENGVRNLFFPLEAENRTVAEVFRSAGYVTGAVVPLGDQMTAEGGGGSSAAPAFLSGILMR